MPIPNRIHLITYPDSLGGDLAALGSTLASPALRGAFGGVHILPPFPSTGDRGFAPTTYDVIDHAFGTWADIERIGARLRIVLDVMVNHVSARSEAFRDYLARGDASPYADMFFPLAKLWPDGKPVAADIERVFLRRPTPYSTYRVGPSGAPVRVWTTFGRTDPSEQVDIDLRSEAARAFLRGVFATFGAHGVRMVRLDAVGYLAKRMGTSCFFVEPDIYAHLDWLAAAARDAGLELLPEVHASPDIAAKLAARGFPTYDFQLPFVVLDCLLNRDPASLERYLAHRLPDRFTMLDCHDGIPVKPDLDGLYEPANAHRIADLCARRGAAFSRILADAHKDSDGFDVHQICSTYYDLLGRDDDAYIAARAIQFFVPGVPQVYYVGLLAGGNDAERYARTGDARELNRHNYAPAEIDEALRRPVVRRLLWLMRLRNRHRAFDGAFRAHFCGRDCFVLRWDVEAGAGESEREETEEAFCALHVNLETLRCVVRYGDGAGREGEMVV